MDDESEKLAALIQSVADGNTVDWQSLDQVATDDDLRRLLHQLKIIEGVSNVHRSQVDVDDGRPNSDNEATGPVVTGSLWGQFQLVRKLGEGAYGEVYHARDTLLEHDVALKLLKPLRLDRSRFLHEARTLVKVRHDNVVRVHGADVHGGRAGFWMDLIQGHTLADVVGREGPRSATEAAVMGQDLCRALAAVHATGIVHRDVKAQNVMRELGGRMVLMDFGAGEIMNATGGAAVPRAGTPLYLAPELFDSTAATVRTDIYALGVLLFYLVTGTYPVRGGSMEALRNAHARGERHHLADVRPDLPDAFVRVVEAALAPEPEQRYATAGGMRSALEGVVVPAPAPVPTPHPAGGTFVRIPTWASGALLAVVAITMLGAVNTAAFNVTFGRTAGFGSESPYQWFVWGARSLVGPMIWSLRTILLVTVAIAAVRVVCRLVPAAGAAVSRVFKGVSRFARARQLDDPTLLLQALMAGGAIAIGILAWVYWTQVSAVMMFIDRAPAEDLAVLQPSNEPQFDAYSRLLEQILLVYGFAFYGVYRIARRSSAPIGRAMTVCAVGLPVVALLVLREIPYRSVYQNSFERVDLEDTRCYQIGTRPGEVLLHCPDVDPPRPRNVVVDDTDPRLRHRGVVESVFTPRGESRPIE